MLENTNSQVQPGDFMNFIAIIQKLVAFLGANPQLGTLLMQIFQLFFGGQIPTAKLHDMLAKLKADMDVEANNNPTPVNPFPPLI